VDDSLVVGKLQTPADGLRNVNGLIKGQTVFWRFLNQALDITAGHDRDNDVGLSFVLTDIVDSNNVGMVAEPPHGPSFAVDTGPGSIIQFLGLDEGKGHITVK